MEWWGNVGPQRALARALRQRGCDVHVVAHDSIEPWLTADGAIFHRVTTAHQFDFAARHTLEDEMDDLLRNILGSPRFAADVMAVHDEVEPDVFIIDCMLVSTLEAAVERGRTFCVLHHLAWMPAGDAVGIMDQAYRSMPGQPPTVRSADLFAKARILLVTSCEAFSDRQDIPSNVVFVGRIREAFDGTAGARKYTDRPFILVSLSSVYQQQDRTLENVAAAVSSLPVEALITTGRGIDPNTLEVADTVDVRSVVDHDGVLPLCDLVVTHGGLGTASFSAGAGVPVLEHFPTGWIHPVGSNAR